MHKAVIGVYEFDINVEISSVHLDVKNNVTVCFSMLESACTGIKAYKSMIRLGKWTFSPLVAIYLRPCINLSDVFPSQKPSGPHST